MITRRFITSLAVAGLISSGVASALIYQVLTVAQFAAFFIRERLRDGV